MHSPIYISVYNNIATSSFTNKDNVNGDGEQILSYNLSQREKKILDGEIFIAVDTPQFNSAHVTESH